MASERVLVILSDIEMGPGGPVDDFPHSDVLADLMLSYNEGAHADVAIDLVFNGDTFDLLKTPYQGAYPRHITAEVALGKMQPILAAHPRFFDAVGRFLDHRRAERRVHFIIGNHDAELAFGDLQSLVRTSCGGDERISFPGLGLDIGKVHIEHGSQFDPLFQVNPSALLVEVGLELVLNISWGAAALLETLIPLKDVLHFHDRLKPKELLFQLVPEIRELLVERFWSYWLRDFWKGYFGSSDPTKKVTWTMLKEVVWRFSSKNPDVAPIDVLTRRMHATDDYALYVTGHKHQSQWNGCGDRKLLQAGCLRNEYMLLQWGAFRPIPKCYVVARLRDGHPVVSEFVEFESPPAPSGYVPGSIFDALPAVRALMASGAERDEGQAARKHQEEREAGEASGGGEG